jgi:hypothetical protein
MCATRPERTALCGHDLHLLLTSRHAAGPYPIDDGLEIARSLGARKVSPQLSSNILLAMQVLVTGLFAAMFLQAAHAVAGIAGASVLGLVFLIVGGLLILHSRNQA